MDWNEETILRLRGMWAEGHSTAEIGRRLGVTKNAVVGKAHRLDLPARPSPIRRDGVSGAQPRRTAPRRVEGPTLPPLSSNVLPVAAPVERVAVAGVAASSPPARPEASRPQLYQPAPLAAVPQAVQPTAPLPVMKPVEVPRAVSHAMPAPVPRLHSAPRPYARSLTCCWPIGEPGTKTFRFCDDAASNGKPYCAQHAALAYVKVRDRREDAA
jgi:GcrA cell cycle regulator